MDSKLTIFCLFFLPLSFLSLFPNIADGKSCEISNHKILVGGDNYYPPFHFPDSDLNPSGFDIDIISAIAKNANSDIEINFGDWRETLQKLENGTIDVVPMFITKSRMNRFDFSDPVINIYHVLFGRADSEFIDNVEDLAKFRVIVQQEGLAHNQMIELGLTENLILINSEPAALNIIATGNYDYALVPEIIGRYAIKEQNLDNVRTLSPPMFAFPYGFAITKGNIELQTLINDGLKKVKRNGDYDKYYDRWFTNLINLNENQRLIRNGLLISLGLIIILSVFFIYKSNRLRKIILKKALRIRNEIIGRKKAESEVFYLAYHDQLTGLENFNKFILNLTDIMLSAQKQNLKTAVIVFNLVEYQLLVQTLGYTLGEKLLRHVANILRNGKGYFVASISPGTFIVVIDLVKSNNEVIDHAMQILRPIEKVHMLGNVSIDLRCRAGLSIYPDDGNDSETIVRKAQLTHAIASESNQRLLTYNSSYEPDERNIQLVADLRRALKHDDELFLVYQPQIELGSGTMTAAEVLIRWQHPEFGLLPPDLFIPLAEKTGQIKDLTNYVISKAIQQQRLFKQGKPMKLCVNVSGKDISDIDFASNVIKRLEGVRHNLVFEITETAATTDAIQVSRNAHAIKDANIELSIDDYGTGYSSLSYLKDLDPNEIKIDRYFIKDLLGSKYDQTLVETTINMAHSLDIKVVAEGVEDAATMSLLKKLNCDVIQGYYISKPLRDYEFDIFRVQMPSFA